MSRKINVIALAVCCLAGTLASRLTAAEIINFGSLTTISDSTTLDLSGVFVYAVDLGRNGGTNQTINGVTFTSQNTTTGLTYNTSGTDMGGTSPSPSYGGPDAAALNSVLAIGHWGDLAGPNYLGFANLTVIPGLNYKLQLLYYEGFGPGTNRHQDLSINGSLAVDNLVEATGVGRVYTYSFNAASATLAINWGGPGTAGTTESSGDIWTHVDGLTVEVLPESSALMIFAGAPLAFLRRTLRA